MKKKKYFLKLKTPDAIYGCLLGSIDHFTVNKSSNKWKDFLGFESNSRTLLWSVDHFTSL